MGGCKRPWKFKVEGYQILFGRDLIEAFSLILILYRFSVIGSNILFEIYSSHRLVRMGGDMREYASGGEREREKKRKNECPSDSKNQEIDKGLTTMPTLFDVLNAEV